MQFINDVILSLTAEIIQLNFLWNFWNFWNFSDLSNFHANMKNLLFEFGCLMPKSISLIVSSSFYIWVSTLNKGHLEH